MSPFLTLFCALTFLTVTFAHSNGPVDKRQDKGPGVDITFESTGGDFSSGGMPLVCAEGCIPAMMNFVLCSEVNTTREGAGPNRPDGVFDPLYSAPCKWFCSETNYTGFTQCLNCYAANGADASETEYQTVLAEGNQLCDGRVQSIVSEITATPTTTAATQTSFTESILTLPTWTGLTSFLAAHATEVGEQGSSSTSSTASASSAPAASSSGAALPESSLQVGKSSSVGIMAAIAWAAPALVCMMHGQSHLR